MQNTTNTTTQVAATTQVATVTLANAQQLAAVQVQTTRTLCLTTKSAQARYFIAQHKASALAATQTLQQQQAHVIAQVMQAFAFTKALATAYVKNNWEKTQAATN